MVEGDVRINSVDVQVVDSIAAEELTRGKVPISEA